MHTPYVEKPERDYAQEARDRIKRQDEQWRLQDEFDAKHDVPKGVRAEDLHTAFKAFESAGFQQVKDPANSSTSTTWEHPDGRKIRRTKPQHGSGVSLTPFIDVIAGKGGHPIHVKGV